MGVQNSFDCDRLEKTNFLLWKKREGFWKEKKINKQGTNFKKIITEKEKATKTIITITTHFTFYFILIFFF